MSTSADQHSDGGSLLSDYLQWSKDNYEVFSRIDSMRSDEIKQISAFHERLILVDLGILSVSITALLTLSPKLKVTDEFLHFLLIFLISSGWVLFLGATSGLEVEMASESVSVEIGLEVSEVLDRPRTQ